MGVRTLAAFAQFSIAVAGLQAPAWASVTDGSACFVAAERIDAGEALSPKERDEAHQACRRTIAATASVTQKYQFEEADFAITGQRHKY